MLKEAGNLDTVTIADFGFAKRLAEAREGAGAGAGRHTLLGTPQYVAPEVIEQMRLNASSTAAGDAVRGVYTDKLDVWSTGVILFRILSGEMPFEGPSNQILYDRIRKGTFSVVRRMGSGQELLYASLHIRLPPYPTQMLHVEGRACHLSPDVRRLSPLPRRRMAGCGTR